MGTQRLRRADARRALTAELAGQHPDWSPRRCELEAERVLRRQDANPHFAGELLRVAPELNLPHRSTVAPEAEARAWVVHPVMQWLIAVVCGAARGRPANRNTLFATMLHMVASSRPELQLSLRTVSQNAAWAWAYAVVVARAATSAVYSTLAAMVGRHPAGLCIHTNLAMVLELAALKKPNGRPRFTDPLLYCGVDGTLVPANVPQRAPKGRSPRERKRDERRIAGPHRPMATFVVYKAGRILADALTLLGLDLGRPPASSVCFGYKVVALYAVKLQVPIIWTLIPANGDERAALRALIHALYTLHPKFPMRYLVGDGLYGMDASLIEWLDRHYGVVGVFPLRSDVRADLSYRQTLGVPKCKHGWAKHIGVRDEWAPERRWREGLAPGERAPGAPSHRWACRADKGCPEISGTTAGEDYRLFSPLPHAGDSRRAALREALYAYRNILESAFAALKHRGVGADWPPRMRVGGDDMARWVISLALLRQTAVRLVHASGTYDEMLQRAITHNLIKMHGKHPIPASCLEARSATQHDAFVQDITGHHEAQPPDTLGIRLTLPIDQPYHRRKLTEYSDIPDRPHSTPGHAHVAAPGRSRAPGEARA